MDFDSCAFHSWFPACRGIFCSASQGDEMGRKWWLGNWDSVWMAAIGGSNIGYAIGRYGGRKLVLHYGHYLFLNWTRLEYVETFFCRHGKLLIMGARFLDGLRQLNGIVAGMAWMPWRQFLFYSSLGAGFWVAFWGVLAYRLGEGVAHVRDVIIKVELWLLAGLAIVLVALAIFLLLRRHRSQTDCL